MIRYTAAYNARRVRAGDLAGEMWLRFGGVSDAEIARYVAVVVPAMAGAEAATARMVAGYLTQLSWEDTGMRFPFAVDPDDLQIRNGVAPTRVYARPAIEARTAVKRGSSVSEAVAAAAAKARNLALTDVSLAQRGASNLALGQDTRVVGYRRVLTGASCAFCATAATQRYHVEQLMPLHPKCDCGVAPIYGSSDSGRTVNADLLEDMKAQGGPEYWKDKGWGVDDEGVIRERREVPLRDDDGEVLRRPDGRQRTTVELGDPIRPVVREHGELGPVLASPDHAFTGPADF